LGFTEAAAKKFDLPAERELANVFPKLLNKALLKRIDEFERWGFAHPFWVPETPYPVAHQVHIEVRWKTAGRKGNFADVPQRPLRDCHAYYVTEETRKKIYEVASKAAQESLAIIKKYPLLFGDSVNVGVPDDHVAAYMKAVDEMDKAKAKPEAFAWALYQALAPAFPMIAKMHELGIDKMPAMPKLPVKHINLHPVTKYITTTTQEV
jgi:hypothetical protein